MGFLSKQGFQSRQQITAFLTVVFSGQIIYSAFESFKIPFYQQLVDYYGLTDTQFGFLFTMLGVAVFFYIPAGWVNNRFHVRQVLIAGLAYRLLTALILILLRPSFPIMLVITFTWGILDAIFWPAVVKGVVLFSGKDNKGVGFGILTAFRAGGEAILNGIVIGVMVIFNGAMLAFQSMMVLYALLTVPMIALVYFCVPADPTTEGDFSEDHDVVALSSKEALQGLIKTLRHPRIWLAGMAGLCVYWVYTTLVYTTPFFVRVYHMSQGTASTYATANALILGLGGGLLGGYIADYIFKSSTLTLGITLCLSGAIMMILVFVPGDSSWTIPALIIMSTTAFVIMMAKALQQAPVAELHLPTEMVGSAMSVNSFMAFASILWAMPINGMILDSFPTDPKTAFNYIFMLMLVVAAVGAACAFFLYFLIKRDVAKEKVKNS
ncbi:MFS transporter [Actinomycetaceae bacterium TAE3-ERU4]|nr:MFS transporter [Actinomycetaceae bacterium TAE3-ERU4]